MKSKRFVSLSILSFLSLGLLTGISVYTSQKANEEVLTTEAWNINVQPSVEASYYSACDGLTGNTLKAKLATFNKPTSPSYDWSRYEAADEAQDDSTAIFCVYTRHNIPKNGHVGSYSWNTWNREHVYTQTAFPNSKTDNHNIFACEGKINQERGDKKYAVLKDKGGSRVTVHDHVTDCYQTNSLFEPCDDAKGEIARACLYCSIYYGYDLNDIFDSINTCLDWNARFTVSPREIYRNNIVQGNQGNRNPFTDHPSYAQAIYGGPAYQGTDPLSPSDPVAVTGVSLNKTSTSLEQGQTLQLTATVTPSNATNKAVTWSSENTSIATVNSAGLITAVSDGSTSITVTTVDGGFTASCALTVTRPAATLSSISLSGNYQRTFDVGESFSYDGLIVTAHFSDGSSQVVDNYSISSPNMSSAGTKTVTVSYTTGGVTKTATYSITVQEPVVIIPVQSVSLEIQDNHIDVEAGGDYQFSALVLPENATNKGVTWTLEYYDISDEGCAEISNSGYLTTSRRGYVIVNVITEDGHFTDYCEVRIYENTPTPAPAKKGCGGSIEMTSVILTTLSVLGIGLLLIKRKTKNNK